MSSRFYPLPSPLRSCNLVKLIGIVGISSRKLQQYKNSFTLGQLKMVGFPSHLLLCWFLSSCLGHTVASIHTGTSNPIPSLVCLLLRLCSLHSLVICPWQKTSVACSFVTLLCTNAEISVRPSQAPPCTCTHRKWHCLCSTHQLLDLHCDLLAWAVGEEAA